jgi:hypothetical protein
MKLCKLYVRPHLKNSDGQSGPPWTAADIEKLENVQRKAVARVSGLTRIHSQFESLGFVGKYDQSSTKLVNS